MFHQQLINYCSTLLLILGLNVPNYVSTSCPSFPWLPLTTCVAVYLIFVFRVTWFPVPKLDQHFISFLGKQHHQQHLIDLGTRPHQQPLCITSYVGASIHPHPVQMLLLGLVLMLPGEFKIQSSPTHKSIVLTRSIRLLLSRACLDFIKLTWSPATNKYHLAWTWVHLFGEYGKHVVV